MLTFLIDECLSPKLIELAINRGFVATSHVVWIGKAGLKDWELKKIIVDDDWTFVTNNSADFRGPSDEPGMYFGANCIELYLEPTGFERETYVGASRGSKLAKIGRSRNHRAMRRASWMWFRASCRQMGSNRS